MKPKKKETMAKDKDKPFKSIFRQVLAERGIIWQSPSELNPHVMFD